MEIKSLSNHLGLCSHVANWYHDQWIGPSSPIQISDIEKGIVEKVILKSDIPHFYITLKEEKLVGVVELKYRENVNHLDYVHWVGGLYVHPSYRNLGVASGLIKHVLLKAAEIGLEELYLQCDVSLVEFYKDLGFIHLHSSKHGDHDTEVMIEYVV